MLYIGQTKQPNPFVRWKKHLYDSSRNRGCPVLGNAIRKYGADTFEFKIILLCFDEDCDEIEKQYIAKYNCLVPNGYNAHPGGKPGGSFKGLTHTPEVRAILSEKSKAYNAQQSVRDWHSNRVKNFYKEPGKREAHSIAMKKAWENRLDTSKKSGEMPGVKLSEATKQKIRESLLKYYSGNDTKSKDNSESAREKRSQAMIKAIGRKISQYTLNGEFVASYDCIKYAADKLGFNKKAINACLVGRTKSSCGFKWTYND